MNRIKFLDTFVDKVDMKQTLEIIETYIIEKKCIQHVVINASKVILINKDEKLKQIVNDCPLINADGQSIVWAAKFLGEALPERVAGIDIFTELVKLSAEKGYKPYFFGATEEVVNMVVEKFTHMYPDLKIAGVRNGYFDKSESYLIAEEIRKSGADILFVAFSSPMKEYWIKENMEIMKVPFAMGVGGSFDIIAGKTLRAPKWMQKSGLEWFYRFLQEPGRMWKRYLVTNSSFIVLVIKEKFRK